MTTTQTLASAVNERIWFQCRIPTPLDAETLEDLLRENGLEICRRGTTADDTGKS